MKHFMDKPTNLTMLGRRHRRGLPRVWDRVPPDGKQSAENANAAIHLVQRIDQTIGCMMSIWTTLVKPEGGNKDAVNGSGRHVSIVNHDDHDECERYYTVVTKGVYIHFLKAWLKALKHCTLAPNHQIK